MRYAYYNNGLYFYVLLDGLEAEPGQVVFDHVPTTEELIQAFPNYEAALLEFNNAAATANRAECYRLESDPIFFKWQRGEATQQEWLDKVNEIKARYPKG